MFTRSRFALPLAALAAFGALTQPRSPAADPAPLTAAALDLLAKHGVTPQEREVQPKAKVETCSACSDGAETILQLGKDVRAATVISSYAAPLLEGCGHVKKGDLRIVGATAPVPFVT